MNTFPISEISTEDLDLIAGGSLLGTSVKAAVSFDEVQDPKYPITLPKIYVEAYFQPFNN